MNQRYKSININTMRNARIIRQMTFKELSQETGIDRGYLEALEGGRANEPYPSQVRAIAEALGVPLYELKQK